MENLLSSLFGIADTTALKPSRLAVSKMGKKLFSPLSFSELRASLGAHILRITGTDEYSNLTKYEVLAPSHLRDIFIFYFGDFQNEEQPGEKALKL